MNIPDYLHGNAQDILAAELRTAERSSLWAVLLKLVPKQDGNQWCVLYGENLQEGIASFGDTPEQAMWRFDEAFASKTGSRV